MTGRLLGVDYGDVRTGVALSDPTGSLASGLTLITSPNAEYVAKRLASLAKEHGVTTVVLGKPLNMDGTEGERVQKGYALRELLLSLLKEEGLEAVAVEFFDERRSTVDASRILRENGKKAKNQKGLIDVVSATLILQGYLDKLRLSRR